MAAERTGSLLQVPGWQPASMRPRPNGRGKHGVLLDVVASGPGFNEAAANWPRKAITTSPTAAAVRSFNEAAAKWPRKVRVRPRPRLSSPRFNEAAAKWPRKARRAECVGGA